MIGTWSHYSPHAALADSSALVLKPNGVARSIEKRLADDSRGWRMKVVTRDGTWRARPREVGGTQLCLRWRVPGRASAISTCGDVVLPSDTLPLLEFGGRYWRRIGDAK
jgi:hypothetical protein